MRPQRSPKKPVRHATGEHASADTSRGERMAKVLGAVSIGLGLPSLVAPRVVERLIGISPTDRTTALIRGVGVQELGVGAGLLKKTRPTDLAWSRVAGDIAHLSLLGRALAAKDSNKRRLTSTIGIVLAITVADVVASMRLSRGSSPQTEAGGMKSKTAITVRRPPEEVYRYWRDFENFPSFMYHVESVRSTGGNRSHWVAKAPAGQTVEWDAEIVEDAPGELIAWRSVEGSGIRNSGMVRFAPAPAGQGTEVVVELEYSPPGGALGAAVAKLFGEEPAQQMSDDVRRFKQVIETGEVVLSDGTPDGTRTQRQFKQRPAQPPEHEGIQA